MEKKGQQLLNCSEMSLQTPLRMENSVPAGQWRLGLCRHKWTRSHHYWASISPSYGAQSHFKDAIPWWDEEKWCRWTGKTGQLLTLGCLHILAIGSLSCPSGFWVFLSSQPCGPWISEIQTAWEFVTNPATFFKQCWGFHVLEQS